MSTHHEHAAALRAALTGTAGQTEASLRSAVFDRATGGAPVPEPYDALAKQIGEDSARVTDAQVDAVRQATGSDKAAFEVVMAACLGAGLTRWDAAVQAIEEATDAPA
jgi:hypothetical protein